MTHVDPYGISYSNPASKQFGKGGIRLSLESLKEDSAILVISRLEVDYSDISIDEMREFIEKEAERRAKEQTKKMLKDSSENWSKKELFPVLITIFKCRVAEDLRRGGRWSKKRKKFKDPREVQSFIKDLDIDWRSGEKIKFLREVIRMTED